MYKHTDYFKKYGRIMQFNKNKKEPFHRWYPFVEGYSKEFIQSIVKEMDRNNLVCLEPFSGSGTTALELQNCGIACFAFEVNPLMYLIARVKLENGYEVERFEYWYDYIVKERSKKIVELETEFNTLYQGEGKKKWNYNTDIGIAVEKLRQVIESISEVIYKELFKVALAAILLDVSNLYRNGKCLSYKKKWEDRKIVEKDVFDKFDEKVLKELKCDIENSITRTKINNKERLYNQDSRIGIASITARTGDGIKQLDKYARHLAKDGRLVDFGYVYMFYMSDVKKETLMSRIDNKTNELLRGLSDELNSIFDGVEMNDMKCWGTAS